MAIDWTSIAVGFGSAVATGVTGILAFGRMLNSNRAENANDTQRINMLEWQSKRLDEQRTEIDELRSDNEKKDETIREYWKTITDLQARLQIIETSQEYLKHQNEELSNQVKLLTESNQRLEAQINQHWSTS